MMSDCDSDADSVHGVNQESQHSNSLEADLASITKLVEQLDQFKPELKKKVGRPKSQPEKNTNPLPYDISVPSILNSICSLGHNILKHLNSIKKENNTLRSRLDILESKSEHPSPNPDPETSVHSYAAVVAGKHLSAPKAINEIDTRLDQIEQKSLDTTIKLDGDFITTKIASYNNNETGNHSVLTRLVVGEINNIVPNILTEKEVVSVSVVGRERKHFKVKLTENLAKIKILKSFKEKKPLHFYISQYLTKNRSFALYRLKKLKKNNEDIDSAYCYGGSVCCKLSGGDQRFTLNNSVAIDKFVSRHNLNE